MRKIENVHIGEVKISHGEYCLTALLGSCVGVGLIWKERNLFGLAHCLLPINPEKCEAIGGRYVDQAIKSLLNMMSATKHDRANIKAIVAGGANMTKPAHTSDDELIGHHNVQTAIKTLDDLNIKIFHEDTKGLNGRTITIYEDGSFDVKKIPRPQAA